MPSFIIDLSDDEAQQLADMAVLERTTPEALVQQWVRQRLVHERERATGNARPMSPRSRRTRPPQERMDLL